jgi:hypothetical protein
MVEAFDINILHIENIRNRIERMDENCNDLVDGMSFANCGKYANIPETFLTRVRQMEQELTGLDVELVNSRMCDSTLYLQKHQKRVQHHAKERGVRKLRSKSYGGV